MPPTTTPASTITEPPKFQAWRRQRGHRWQVVATADDEPECFRRLLEICQSGPPCGAFDEIILPYPQEP